jgi:predicted RNase H-like nuclease (RuvC/YqgF family)
MPYLSRTLCSVLDEMRACHKTRNFTYLPGLIEEAQSMGNRMEAAIEDKNDLDTYRRQGKAVEKENKKLRKEQKALQEEIEKLKKKKEKP